jgi:hypothetical protein
VSRLSCVGRPANLTMLSVPMEAFSTTASPKNVPLCRHHPHQNLSAITNNNLCKSRRGRNNNNSTPSSITINNNHPSLSRPLRRLHPLLQSRSPRSPRSLMLLRLHLLRPPSPPPRQKRYRQQQRMQSSSLLLLLPLSHLLSRR